jgi:hypothetical protein
VTLNQQPVSRNSLEGKLMKIQQLLSVSYKIFPSFGHRFDCLRGARVVVVTSSANRVVNTIRKVPLHPELLQQSVFMFSYFEETLTGAFECHYAVPVWQDGRIYIKTKSIGEILNAST